MHSVLTCAALIFSGSFLLSAAAAVLDAEPIAAQGRSVIAGDWRQAMSNKPDADWKVESTFGGFSASPDGVRLTTLVQPKELYHLQTKILNDIPLAKGDTLLIRMNARSLKADKSTGATKVIVGFSRASHPWTGSAKLELGLTAAWEHFDIPFTCVEDYQPKEAKLNFNYGFPAQELELADIQLLNFGPNVPVASLPKTKRKADFYSDEVYAQEFARIAAMRQELNAIKDPVPNGKILHVSAAAVNADGDGTSERPFKSIDKALAVVKPGETILVGAGEYRNPEGLWFTSSGTPDAWIFLHAAPGPRPKLISSGWAGIGIQSGLAYIEVRGFELEWVYDPSQVGENGIKVHGVGIAPAYASHHLRILNNVVHDFGTGGICTLDCDYVLIEGNEIYRSCHTSPYGSSGISLCRAFNFDEYKGYHNVIRNNVIYDNELTVPPTVESGGDGHSLTDGNGIIIDVFNRSRANPLKKHYLDRNGPLEPYRGRTLVENNLVYNNGGRGIHVFRTDKVDVINNTCYLNQKSRDINAGELTAIEANEVLFANNIAWGRPEKRLNAQDGSRKVFWHSNLCFGNSNVLWHPRVMVDQDPLLAAPALDAKADGFHLRTGSPAAGYGIPTIAPRDDLLARPRDLAKGVDLGAFRLEK